LFRALAIVAMLLLAALAAGPAYAQDAGGDPTTPPVSESPPPSPVDQTPPADPAPTPDPTVNTPPADITPPASETPVATDPGAGQSTPATNDSPADAGHKQPARPSDEFTTTTSGPSSSATSPSSSSAGPSKDLTPSSTGHSDSWLGQDTFVIDKTTTTTDHEGLKTVKRRFAGLFLIGASTKATRTEAKARRANETAKVSAIGSGGPPAPGNPLPNQNPFFNLLSGPGGIAASLMLASTLAVLGAAFVLPRDRLRAFRTPTVTWSPLAYVPPIELPG
jgi:hypothetical protein